MLLGYNVPGNGLHREVLPSLGPWEEAGKAGEKLERSAAAKGLAWERLTFSPDWGGGRASTWEAILSHGSHSHRMLLPNQTIPTIMGFLSE